MQPFEEMIRKFFDSSDFPNPFDPEGFGRFLQEQIKNALPNDPNTLSQIGLDATGKNDVTQRLNQFPSAPHIDRARLPAVNNMRGHRKGTTSGLNRAPVPQPVQPVAPQQSKQELNYQAFETHDELIVRVQIPKDPKLAPKNIKLTSYQINFNNEEQNEPLLKIQLPKAVDPDGTKYGYRDGILEVKLLKRSFEPTKDIDISNAFNTSKES